MLYIGKYLHKHWGDPIIHFFSNDQAKIKATKWYYHDKKILAIESIIAMLWYYTK